MRTISTALQALYDAPLNARSVFVKVEINDATSWHNLSDSYGLDWVKRVRYGFAVDSPVGDFDIELWRQNAGVETLSPFISTSRFNATATLIQPGREVRISTATMPLDTLPASTDYVVVMNGYIDRVSMKDSINIKGRDRGGIIQDRFIENVREYGDDGGSVQVQAVMQSILDNVNTIQAYPITINLYSPAGDDTSLPGSAYDDTTDATSWAIKRYAQRREPVLDALKTLASQIGYDLRYRWHANTSEFRLVMSNPSRTSPSVDHTFVNDRFIVQSIEHSRENIRNAVFVTYTDQAGARQVSDDKDATSIAKYGRRWCEISEDSSSQIDTSTEADKLRDAALDDLKEPTMTMQARTPYFYVAEIGDYYTLEADNIFFDADQSLALQAVQHEIRGGEAWSTLTVSGKPRSQERAWVGQQAAPSYIQLGPNNFSPLSSPVSNLIPNAVFSQFTRG